MAIRSRADLRKERGDSRFWAPLACDWGFYEPLMSGSIDGTDEMPHDRAVARAMQAKYKPNEQVKGDPKATVFVARLSPNTTNDTLKAAFSRLGRVVRCRVVRDIVTGRAKGYGFVEFKRSEDAKEAYYECHKMVLDDSVLLVERESERALPGWVPRRLGGGFGGKKESGQLRFGGRDRPFRKPIVLGSRALGPSGPGGRGRGRGRGREEEHTGRWSRREEGQEDKHCFRDNSEGWKGRRDSVTSKN